MPSFLASKDNSKSTGQQQFIETADPGLVGIRDDLIIADGEKDVSGCSRFGVPSSSSLADIALICTQINGFVWYLSAVVSSLLLRPFPRAGLPGREVKRGRSLISLLLLYPGGNFGIPL